MSVEASQKVLKIFGIISIVFGSLGIIAGILVMMGGGVGAAALGGAAAEYGVDSETMAQASAALGAAMILGFISLLTGVVGLIEGIFCIRASNDAYKATPAWIFAIIALVLNVISFILTLTSGGFNVQSALSAVVGIGIDAFIFYAANTVRNSVRS